MALKKCVDCGNMVSTGADACPHCGKKASSFNLIIQFVFAFVLFVGGLFLLGSKNANIGFVSMVVAVFWTMVVAIIWKIKYR